MQWPWMPSQSPIDLHRRALLNEEEFGAGAWEQPLDSTDYFVIDMETSDFSPERGIVLSVAAASARLDCETVVNKLHYHVLAHTDLTMVPEHIWQLTGLSPAELEHGDDWKQVLFDLLQMADRKVWIAHHARHELSFLHKYTRGFWRMKIQPIVIDTALVAKALFRKSYVPTLDEVCQWLNVPIRNRHQADEDVRMTAIIWKKEAAMCQSRGLMTVSDVLEWTLARA